MPQNRRRIRSLISKKQHQREKLLATLAISQALRAEKKANVSPSRVSHVTATLQEVPIHKETTDDSETFSDCQPAKTHRCLIDSEHTNLSALRWYAYSLESWVSLLAVCILDLRLTSIEFRSGEHRIRLCSQRRWREARVTQNTDSKPGRG